MYKNVLVPIDGSETSTRGLREAINLAQGNRGKLLLLHVVNTAVVAMEYAEAFTSSNDEIPRKLREAGEAALKQAESLVKQSDLQAESVLLGTSIDNTGELIIRQATDRHADIIVMGTHGRRGLGRLVLGSNAEYVLRHTTVPVLLVRKQ